MFFFKYSNLLFLWGGKYCHWLNGRGTNYRDGKKNNGLCVFQHTGKYLLGVCVFYIQLLQLQPKTAFQFLWKAIECSKVFSKVSCWVCHQKYYRVQSLLWKQLMIFFFALRTQFKTMWVVKKLNSLTLLLFHLVKMGQISQNQYNEHNQF